MPRIKRVYRADTSDIQGEGSYVEFKSPKVYEIRAVQSAETGKDYDLLLAMVRNNIVDWNWSDEDDEPLPLPGSDMGAVGDLMADEVVYLVWLLVSAKAADLKN